MKKVVSRIFLIGFVFYLTFLPLYADNFNFSDNDKAVAHYNIAVNFLKRDEYQKAIDEFQTSLSYNPDNSNAYYNMGITYYNMNKFEKALEYYNKVLLYKPNDALTHYNIGVVYSGLHKMDEAAKSYINAIKYKYDLVEAHANLAMIYQYQEKKNEFKEEIDILKKLDPNVAKMIIDTEKK